MKTTKFTVLLIDGTFRIVPNEYLFIASSFHKGNKQLACQPTIQSNVLKSYASLQSGRERGMSTTDVPLKLMILISGKE